MHGSLCSLASSSQIQRLDYKITRSSLKIPASSLLCLGSIPQTLPALLVTCVYLCSWLFLLASCRHTCCTHAASPGWCFLPALCYPHLTLSSLEVPSPRGFLGGLAASGHLLLLALPAVLFLWLIVSLQKCLLKCHLLEHSSLPARSKRASFSPFLSLLLFSSTACLFCTCL